MPASEFQAEGSLVATVYRADGSVFDRSTSWFVFSTKDREWIAKAIYGEGYYQLFGCDGTNVYSYLVDPHPHVPKGVVLTSIPGVITSGEYPSSATHHITLPWFAFRSGFYYMENRQASAELPVPWAIAQVQSLAHVYRTEIEAFDDSPWFTRKARIYGFPNRGASITTNTMLRPSQNTREKRSETLAMLGTMGEALQATYEVKESYLYSGIRIPKLFELHQYFPNRAAKERKLYVQYVGTVTGITVPVWVSPLPSLTNGFVVVTDYRFPAPETGMDGIKYTVTNHWPVSAVDPILLSLCNQQRTEYASIMKENRRIKSAVRILLGAAILIPPVWIVFKRGRRKRPVDNN